MNDRLKVLEFLRKNTVCRPCDLAREGIRVSTLWELAQGGKVERIGRGLYRLPGHDASLHASLAAAAKAVPRGVVCMLSALAFHEIGTQLPFEVWMAIDRKARRPQPGGVALRFFRFSGAALAEGVRTHRIEGVAVKIYDPAKTVADCFKYRNKIGIDVAVEALREGWGNQRFTMDELWRYAGICRVSVVMRPYLEMLP